MSNLKIQWNNPTPNPTCGFKILYRRNTDAKYTEVDTSGNTSSDASGNTTLIPILSPASFEGTIQSNCCSANYSSGVSFGTNGYSPFSIAVTVPSNGLATVTITSTYGNPYSTIITGSFIYTVSGTPFTQNFSITYPANSTTFSINISGTFQTTSVISSILVTSSVSIFDNGGQLQNLDIFSTPGYFQYYWLATSGTTAPAWNGSPASLPSFVLNSFTVTELGSDGTTILSGNLLLSYILHRVFSNSFNSLNFEIFDATNALVGSRTSNKIPLGIRNESIEINKAVSPLNSSTQFTMKVYWPDNTLVDTHTFYLP